MATIETSWDGYKWFIERLFDRDATRPHEKMVITTLRELGSTFIDKRSRGTVSGKSLFVDVGAHVGMYTVRLAHSYDTIIAVEPDPENIRTLEKNLALNGLLEIPYEIKVLPVACGESDGEAYFKCQQVGGHIVSKARSGKNVIPVKVKSLDSIVFENVNVDDYSLIVVKVDVEGWEEKVVRGARKLIKNYKPVFVIEHHEYRGYKIEGTHERIIEFLKPTHHALNLNEVQWIYVPKDMDLSPFKRAIVNHWFYKLIRNVEQGKPWYFGLPNTWWYGMSILDFYHELPNHVLKEKEWIERL